MRKVLVVALALAIAFTVVYRAKVEWVDLYQERQIAGLWLLLVQRGKLTKAEEMIIKEAYRGSGLKGFAVLEKYYRQGYFEGAAVRKMFFDRLGRPTAMIAMPENPVHRRLFLRVAEEETAYKIKDIYFTAGKGGFPAWLAQLFTWKGGR